VCLVEAVCPWLQRLLCPPWVCPWLRQSVRMPRTSPVVSPLMTLADATRASNTAEFAEFGTGDYRDDHSMEVSTSDVLVRRRREALQESRAAKQ